MKTTAHQVELQGVIAEACGNSALNLTRTIESVDRVCSGIDLYLLTVEDPDERLTWLTTKLTWVRLSTELNTWWKKLQETT